MSLDPINQTGLIPPSSEDLLARFEHDGDPAAFAELVSRHLSSVHAICRRATGNQHDAEDAAQSTFLSLALQARNGNGIGKVTAWLSQVARRTALDLVRARGRRQKRETRIMAEQHDAPVPSPDHELLVAELRQLLTDEIAKLAPKYRLPVMLHYFDGLDTHQTSKKLGCTPGALNVRLHRARKLLGQKLRKRGVQGGFAAVYSTIKTKLGDTLQKVIASFTTTAAKSRPMSQMISQRMMSLARPFGFHGGKNQLRWTASLICLVGAALADTPNLLRKPVNMPTGPTSGGANPLGSLLRKISDAVNRFQNSLHTGLSSAKTNNIVPSPSTTDPSAIPMLPTSAGHSFANAWNIGNINSSYSQSPTLTGFSNSSSSYGWSTGTTGNIPLLPSGDYTSVSNAIPQYQLPGVNETSVHIASYALSMVNSQSSSATDLSSTDSSELSGTSTISPINIFPSNPTPPNGTTLDPINGVGVPEPTTGVIVIGAAWVMMNRRRRKKQGH